MSKVVSGIGNAVSGVLKGAVSVVKSIGEGVGKVVKSIASSPIGKAILIAGAIYFGGAALAGGYGSAMGGGSFFTGMGAGVSSAASSLSSAWTSAMAGNFAEAGSTIGGSWSTAAQSGAMTSPGYAAALSEPTVSLAEAPAAPSAAPSAAPNVPPTYEEQVKMLDSIGAESGEVGDQVSRMDLKQLSNVDPAASQYSLNGPGVSNGGLTQTSAGYTGGNGINLGNTSIPYNPSSPGVMSSIWNSPYTAPALISGGMQVGGAIIQGKAQEEALKEQREYEARMAAEARARYNTNVGAQLWDPNQQTAIYQNQGPAWDPYAEARARAAQYAPAPTGLAAKYMNA